MRTIELLSNVKYITSGLAPTAANLNVGELAFGRLTIDGKYHIFGNNGTGVTDIVLDSVENLLKAMSLDKVLANGNTAENISILLSGVSDGYKVQSPTGSSELIGDELNIRRGSLTLTAEADEIRVVDSTLSPEGQLDTISFSIAHGFLDQGYKVLTGNPATSRNAFTPAEQALMRDRISTYSRSEIEGKLSAIFDYKGTIDTYANLLKLTGMKSGDTYQVVDRESKLYAWVANADGTTGKWEILGFILDLSNYYTIQQVEDLVAATRELLEARIGAVETRTTVNENDIADIDVRLKTAQKDIDDHKVAPRTHSTNDYTDGDVEKVGRMVITGDGSKVLTNDGEYSEVVFVVEAI